MLFRGGLILNLKMFEISIKIQLSSKYHPLTLDINKNNRQENMSMEQIQFSFPINGYEYFLNCSSDNQQMEKQFIYFFDLGRLQQLGNKPIYPLMDAQMPFEANEYTKRMSSLPTDTHIAETIQGYFGSFLPQSTHLILKVINNFNLKLHLKVSESGLIIKGNLVYANGTPVKIPAPYKSFFLTHSNALENSKDSFYETLKDTDSLGFIQKIPIKQGQAVASSLVEQTAKDIIKTIPNIIKTLQVAGLTHSYGKISRELKRSELKLKREVLKLLSGKQKVQNKTEIQGQTFFSKGSAIRQAERIQEKQNSIQDEKDQMRKGGYFQIEKKTCTVTENGKDSTKDLGLKKLRKNRGNKPYCTEKLSNEWSIIEEIVNPKHCLTYWTTQKNNKNEVMMMDFIESTLEQEMQGNIPVSNVIQYSSQIVDAISILHESGIVHRDIKPENFLVSEEEDKKVLKIIDFGESVLANKPFNEELSSFLGCTLPFSPLECSLQVEEGYNKKQIDLWSVGMILYELLFKRIPVTYSRCFGPDIAKGWNAPDQFSIFPQIYKKKGVRMIEEIYVWIALHTVCIKQKERLGLQKLRLILDKTKQFFNDINQII